MAKRVLRVSLDLAVDGYEFAPSTRVLEAFSHNFGNLAFVYASSILFPGEHKLFSRETARGPLKGENYDYLLFPAANNLNPTSDLGWLADVMEQVNVPTLIIGLGVQAPLGGGAITLPAGSLRFLDLLRKRGLPVGVRGKQTQDFLVSHGIHNSVVTGCPSNFLNPAPNLGELLEPKFAALHETLEAVALNLEYFRLETGPTQALVDWGMKQGGVTIFQSDERLVSLLRGDLPASESNFVDYVCKYFLGRVDHKLLHHWLSQHCRLFIHTPSWIDYLRTVSFSTGTRFHGNMLAIQAGTPALVLYHDQRTLEMTQTMRIPSAPWEGFDRDAFGDQIRRLEFDGKAFDANRRMLAGRVVDLCAKVGFPVVDRLKALAQA